MKYKSFNTKLILTLLIALPAFTIFIGALAILHQHEFQGSALKNYLLYSAIYFLLVLFVWKNTYYNIHSNILQIRNFGLSTKQLAIDQITGIEKVDKTPVTATQPAMNISGLLIRTKTEDVFFVSPIREHSFLAELQKRNAKIEITDPAAAHRS